MTVTLYNNKSDTNVLNKDIGNPLKSVTCTIKSDISILSPILILEYVDTTIRQLKFNYVYISEYHRYYHITDIVLGARQTMYLYCTVDVLMSYKEDIKNLECTVIRQENEKNSLVVDTMIKCNNREQLTSKLGKEVKIYPYSWILATK